MRLALCLIIGVLAAAPASAKLYQITVDGTLTEQLAPGSDANLAVGSKVTVTMRFDSRYVENVPSFGYQVISPYFSEEDKSGVFQGTALETTGRTFFRIDAPGLTWTTRYDELDGFPFYFVDESAIGGPNFYFGRPIILFSGSKVVGLSGYMYSGDGSGPPTLTLGSEPGTGERYVTLDGNGQPVAHATYTPAKLSANFLIDNSGTNPINQYKTPGFRGVWDFGHSSVTAVPESASWMMMIAGFGMVGAAMRRRGQRGRSHVELDAA